MQKHPLLQHTLSRRDLLRASLTSMGLGALAALPLNLASAAEHFAAQAKAQGKILVILELSGGNDGLNTVVPYGDDAYYRQRPNIGLPQNKLRILDEHFGLNPGMSGFERLFKDGKLAIIHGCGYDNPSYSHFTSMAYWQTAAPNSGEEYGWVGRLADAMAPDASPNFLVNIADRQSLAVRSQRHVPVVFDEPERFMREAFYEEKDALAYRAEREPKANGNEPANSSRQFLLDIASSANDASILVRDAWDNYDTPIDYGIARLDLPKVAALIAADLPTSLYYVSYRNNAFDTHVFQNDLHQRLLTYTSDAVSGFMQDMQRLGRSEDVVMMIFSEFGRRVPENVSLGTDHGAANVMFMVGDAVKGGHYGDIPSLTALTEGDNLQHTTDFRRVYQSVMQGWLGQQDVSPILRADFGRFDMFS